MLVVGRKANAEGINTVPLFLLSRGDGLDASTRLPLANFWISPQRREPEYIEGISQIKGKRAAPAMKTMSRS
jgi:hypothetical protein